MTLERRQVGRKRERSIVKSIKQQMSPNVVTSIETVYVLVQSCWASRPGNTLCSLRFRLIWSNKFIKIIFVVWYRCGGSCSHQ